jgi:hypothetical protein
MNTEPNQTSEKWTFKHTLGVLAACYGLVGFVVLLCHKSIIRDGYDPILVWALSPIVVVGLFAAVAILYGAMFLSLAVFFILKTKVWEPYVQPFLINRPGLSSVIVPTILLIACLHQRTPEWGILESAAGWTLAVVTVVVGYYQINQLDKSGRLNWLSKKRPEWLWMAIGSALLLAPLVIASVVLIRFGIELPEGE